MRPLITPQAMRSIDAAAPDSMDVLIDQAGWAVARCAREMLGGVYGRRVLALAGPGNNGADARAAVRHLSRWGARCHIVDAADQAGADELLARYRVDLVLDGCYGTGIRSEFEAPDVGHTPILAIDIPSGVDGLTGRISGAPLRARRTVTFVAAKPGLLLWPGADLVGDIEVADIGLEPGEHPDQWVEPRDLEAWPCLPPNGHKWKQAVWIIGGSPGMEGAPKLAASGAAKSGATMVLVSVPGAEEANSITTESVARSLEGRWADTVLAEQHRVRSVVIGPGLSLASETDRDEVRRLVAEWPHSVVVDAGGLDALAGQQDLLRSRSVPAVLTPHDGEFSRLQRASGTAPTRDSPEADESVAPSNRITETVAMAKSYSSIFLRKGPTTIVATSDGRSFLSTAGDQRLATAGSGDVLAGVIGAGLAAGLDPELAASLGSELHGLAATSGPTRGLVAGELPQLIAGLLSRYH